MFLQGKALFIYKAKRIVSMIQAAIMVTVTIFIIGGIMIAF